MLATLTHKRVILGVSGGIAAYKSADLVRRLRDAGAEVQVVMTAAAQQFITPLTMQALSGNPVHTELLNAEAEETERVVLVLGLVHPLPDVAPVVTDGLQHLDHLLVGPAVQWPPQRCDACGNGAVQVGL